MSDFTVTGLAARDRIEALFLTGKPEVDLLELRVGAEVGVPAMVGVADEAPDGPSLKSIGRARWRRPPPRSTAPPVSPKNTRTDPPQSLPAMVQRLSPSGRARTPASARCCLPSGATKSRWHGHIGAARSSCGSTPNQGPRAREGDTRKCDRIAAGGVLEPELVAHVIGYPPIAEDADVSDGRLQYVSGESHLRGRKPSSTRRRRPSAATTDETQQGRGIDSLTRGVLSRGRSGR